MQAPLWGCRQGLELARARWRTCTITARAPGKEPRVTMMPGVAEALGAAGAAAFVCFGCGVGKQLPLPLL